VTATAGAYGRSTNPLPPHMAPTERFSAERNIISPSCNRYGGEALRITHERRVTTTTRSEPLMRSRSASVAKPSLGSALSAGGGRQNFAVAPGGCGMTTEPSALVKT